MEHFVLTKYGLFKESLKSLIFLLWNISFGPYNARSHIEKIVVQIERKLFIKDVHGC